jgi:hypothetical protein
MGRGSNTKLGFEALVPNGWYGSMSYYDGYGGFNFEDMELVTRKWITEHGLWEDGFGSVLHGDAETYTTAYEPPFGLYSWMVPGVAGTTFNLKSGIFAMETKSKENFAFFYGYGVDGQLQGKFSLHLTNVATTIDFTHYGSEFKNLTALKVEGYNVYPWYSPILIMDNIRVHWNGRQPGAHGPSSASHRPHIAQDLLAQSILNHGDGAHPDCGGSSGDTPLHPGELNSLDTALRHSDPGGGIVEQFSLPRCEHFGT